MTNLSDTATKRPAGRDPRLDFFRGIALWIIFIAHVPTNWLAQFIPARYGFSDAADQFVFLSGFAAAIAFGGAFGRNGFWIGSARVLFRCGQLYLSHLMLFFTLATVCVVATWLFPPFDYVGKLNLYRFFNDTQTAMVELFHLAYVPNYFDILPMYLVVLAMIPIAMLFARVHPWLPLAFAFVLYLINWNFGIELPADRSVDREWFFNPFGWQLIFLTGFALSAGWVTPPPASRWLMALCVAYVLLAVVLTRPVFYNQAEWLFALREWARWYSYKTDYGILRWLHFLALVYICVVALKGREHWLFHPVLRPILRCGQQALPVFITSMVLSWIAGVALDQLGRHAASLWLVNVTGLALLVAVAYGSRFFKRKPWQRPQPDAAPQRAKSAALARLQVQPGE